MGAASLRMQKATLCLANPQWAGHLDFANLPLSAGVAVFIVPNPRRGGFLATYDGNDIFRGSFAVVVDPDEVARPRLWLLLLAR